MNTKYLGMVLVCGIVVAAPVTAQESQEPPEDPAHDELRALRAGLVEALNSGDIEAQLRYVHPNVVVTWQNNEVNRGHDGIRAFMEDMGTDAFQHYVVEPTPDELTILSGDDTGISFGRSVARYNVLGKEFEFENRWTATLVKENDEWLIASYQVSLNALDNPILNAAKSALYWVGGIGLVVGVIVGMLVGKLRTAKQASSPA